MPQLKKVKNTAATFVIIGATGDLARKRIFPSLFKLFVVGLLPGDLQIIATARSKHTSDDFRDIAKEMVAPKEVNYWQDFASKIVYVAADVAKNINLGEIARLIDEFEKTSKVCPSRIFYMSVSPTIYFDAFENLGRENFHLGCSEHGTKPRIIVEKPFGRDLKSAGDIARKLSQYFREDQIFRIDHYLGKETVQNIFAFRFGNEIFKPVWNNNYIDHVQITTAEHIGVEKRGEFYDQTGALRDIVQNHLLQLLTLVTMEEPKKFEAASIRQEKLAILKSIKRAKPDEIVKSTVRGQYEGYLTEEKIAPKSQTETYALVKLFVENPRWQGVPFYLRTGKKLPGKVTSIILQFREMGHKLFANFWEKPLPNHITLQIQPNEGIGLRLVAKKPGLATTLEPVDMEFCYQTSFDVPQPEAYERLLLDVILGDQSLFISQSEVEASWKVIDPIGEVWASGKPPLAIYKPGSWGPDETERLIERDGRQWLAPILSICKI